MGRTGCNFRTYSLRHAMMVSLLAVLPCHAQSHSQKVDSVIFRSFRGQDDLRNIKAKNADLTLATARTPGESKVLEVKFDGLETASVEFAAQPRPWNWQNYGSVAVKVSNRSDQEVWLGIELTDAENHQASAMGNVEPHDSVIYYYPIGPSSPLSYGMRGGPLVAKGILPFSVISAANTPIDVDAVTKVKLTFDHAVAGGSIAVENMQLLPNFQYDNIVDSFGQYTGSDWPSKVHNRKGLLQQKKQQEREIRAKPAMSDRDSYGGWASGPHISSTGFFATTYRDGKWWLVDPAGHLFFSFGMDVVNAAGAATLVEGREKMFRDLPAPKGRLSKYYGSIDHVTYGPTKQRRTYNFYEANLDRKYGTDWTKHWQVTALDRLQAWGFNTIGTSSDATLFPYKRAPYVVSIKVRGHYADVPSGQDYWGLMPDPFDPQYAVAVDESIRETAQKYRDDSWCIGYFVDNELSWGGGGAVGGGGMGTERDHYGLAYGTLSRDANSPAKKAFVAQLQSHYADMDALNKAWNTHFASWSALLLDHYQRSEPLTPAMRKDFSSFLTLFGDQYFKTIRNALKKYDPNHLYLGCKFAWRTPEAIDAAARYNDVVSFDKYSSELDPQEWAFTTALHKPCIYAEFHFGALDRGMFHTGLVSNPDQRARAAMYKRYVESVEDLPASVGALWFQYFDEPLTGRAHDGENYSIGFVSVTDTPYPELVAAAKDVHSEVYKRRGEH